MRGRKIYAQFCFAFFFFVLHSLWLARNNLRILACLNKKAITLHTAKCSSHRHHPIHVMCVYTKPTKKAIAKNIFIREIKINDFFSLSELFSKSITTNERNMRLENQKKNKLKKLDLTSFSIRNQKLWRDFKHSQSRVKQETRFTH